MLAVMLAGSAGVVGLFVGALITNNPVIGINMTESLILSALSAAGPMAAVVLVVRAFGITNHLGGLKWWHLFVFAAVGALCNVIPTQAYFYLKGHVENLYHSVGAMLVGDLLGTVIVLYAASLVAKLVVKFTR